MNKRKSFQRGSCSTEEFGLVLKSQGALEKNSLHHVLSDIELKDCPCRGTNMEIKRYIFRSFEALFVHVTRLVS